MHYDIESPRAPIKAWIPPDQIEESALKQLRNTATCPWVVQVSVMPDSHFGIGATVGSVVATKGAIAPACVGVDISCFSGGTKVPLIDGKSYTMRDLARRSAPFLVYAFDVKRG